MINKATIPPAIGVSRDAESPGGKGVRVAFARALTDDELRNLHRILATGQVGWIAVADRLPELNQAVALLNVDRWMNTGGDFDINWCGAGWLSTHGNNYWSVIGESRGMTMDSVTHWMLLPDVIEARAIAPMNRDAGMRCTYCCAKKGDPHADGCPEVPGGSIEQWHSGQPVPVCPICHDTGIAFGKVCECGK